MLPAILAVATFGWMARQYVRQSVEEPGTQLPLQDVVDVKRWRHDGTQPMAVRDSNLFPGIPWEAATTTRDELGI